VTDELICVTLQNNKLIPPLFGAQDKHLSRIEKMLNVSTSSRGNTLSISGSSEDVTKAKSAIEKLYHTLETGADIALSDVDAAIRMATPKRRKTDQGYTGTMELTTRKKHIVPYSHHQSDYIETLKQKELVFAVGPAGTGKTYLAVAVAVSMFINHQVERIILTRPAVEAGEKLGFLPGDLKEKIDPYLRPLYDALHDMLPAELVKKHMENGEIEIAPLAFMRGRTLSNAFIILDEAQNTTPTQMKMFLTRLGEGGRMAITGDPSQVDLPRDIKSGLSDALEKLHRIDDIGIVTFDEKDIIRHPLTAKIVNAYNVYEKRPLKEPEHS
jgi:phosphate starvation-inducible protein PhoH and related proteins